MMNNSRQELAEGVSGAISRSSTLAELWAKLAALAAERGQSVDILNEWLDRLLAKVSREYGVEGEGLDLEAMRNLALNCSEAASEAAMELLLSEQEEAVNEIVIILSRHKSNTGGTPALKIKKLYIDARVPERATQGATGLDLFAYIKQENGRIMLQEKPKLVGTGVAVEVPGGYDVQIRPRSGLSAKGVMVAFGTVDSDYRGEVMVTMYTLSRESSFEVRHGDRIAQLVVTKLADLPVEEVAELSLTRRGAGGHGSTGMA